MVAPTYLVEADLSGTAYGGTPTWTDITDHVLTTGDGQPISITVGRQDEGSDVTPSQCSLTLINDDGRFTPGNTASPYYPHVLPAVRIRVLATVGTANGDRFDGQVDSWEVTPGAGSQTLCTVNATDALGRMGLDAPLRSIYREEVFLDSPIGYWTLEEGSGTSFADISGVSGPAVLTQSKNGGGGYAYGVDSGVITDGQPGFQVTRGGQIPQGWSPVAPTPQLPWAIGSGSSLEFWFATTTVGIPLVTQRLQGWPAQYAMASLDSSGHLVFTITTNTGATTMASAGTYQDGKWHHVVITQDAGSAQHIYADGVSVASSSSMIYPNNAVGSALMIGGGPLSYATAQFAHVVLYNTAQLTTTRITAHRTAALTGFAGEATGAHMARLLSYRPNTGSSLDAGDGTVGLHDIVGGTLQQAVLDTANAEGGVAYINPEGQLRFKARHLQYNRTSSFTLDASLDQVQVGTTFRIDTQELLNDVSVSRPNGASTARAVDTASQTAYGVRATQDTLIVNTDFDTANAAGWKLATRKTPLPTTPSMTVNMLIEPDSSLVQSILNSRIWQQMTVTNLPATAPASSMNLVIEGWTETLGLDTWTIAFNTGQTPPATLRADGSPSTLTKLDSGLKIGW